MTNKQSVYVDKQIHQRLKALADQQGKKLYRLVEEACEQKINEEKAQSDNSGANINEKGKHEQHKQHSSD